ncbi:hypothetical protein C731_4213 [Mycolicibacterium hassiacum DSM 44199]|uniref:Uncharacterized protein n=1 Tax=Mycolicibacterium hassiacum (strain DSM 44199 / CIP 105218 / JCM 12690 / 3849) TaxID=1122247 RepID=K5BCW0_MYCHD|nr:hypothetical protein C731_4213 [Mycolicibacterium hassiacum DSM 44199]
MLMIRHEFGPLLPDGGVRWWRRRTDNRNVAAAGTIPNPGRLPGFDGQS